MQLRYKSPSKAFVADAAHHFKNWVPRRGPTGGRVVIDRLFCVFDGDDVDVTVAAVEGEECWRFFKRVMVEQIDGRLRWNLRGDECRIASYLLEGADRTPEFADLAAAANQTPQIAIPIPMSKRFAQRPKDYGLPAELLSKLTIEGANLAELGVGGATVAVVGNYYVIAECHEERNVELKAEDQVTSQPFTNTAGGQLVVGGRLQDLSLFARGAGGGASMANFTDIRIDGIIPETLLANPDLKEMYKVGRATATNLESTDGSALRNDPHTLATPRAVPVLWSTDDSSPFDGPALDEAILRCTNTVADVIAIYRAILPKSEGLARGVMRRHGVRGDGFRMKTRKGTKRDPRRWHPNQAVFMPVSAPDRNNRE